MIVVADSGPLHYLMDAILLRRRANSSRSAVVIPVFPLVRSARACSTQLRSEDSVRPRSRAAAATLWPSSSTSRMALALKSSVKLRRVRLGSLSDMVDIVSASRKMSTRIGSSSRCVAVVQRRRPFPFGVELRRAASSASSATAASTGTNLAADGPPEEREGGHLGWPPSHRLSFEPWSYAFIERLLERRALAGWPLQGHVAASSDRRVTRTRQVLPDDIVVDLNRQRIEVNLNVGAKCISRDRKRRLSRS